MNRKYTNTNPKVQFRLILKPVIQQEPELCPSASDKQYKKYLNGTLQSLSFSYK
jgi:hypothetical protein